MSSIRFESFLARLLVDSAFREAYFCDARRVVEHFGLDAAEEEAALAIDRPGLRLAARSIAAKRTSRDGDASQREPDF